MAKKILIVALLLVVAFVGGYLAYSFGKKTAERAFEEKMAQQAAERVKNEAEKASAEGKNEVQKRKQQGGGIPVKVAAITQEDIHLSRTFYGTATPYAEANVQGEQGGKIVFLKGEEGDAVSKGEPVVRFDDSDAQLELQRALASKNTSLQNVKQAQSNFDTIQANVKRNEELLKDGFVSRQQVDELNNQLQAAQASLSSAQESVKQADAQISLLRNMLKDFTLTAPISGIIDEKRYNLQEVYSAGDIIYHIIDIDKIYVEVEVPETSISQLAEGMQVTVFFDPLEGQEFGGTIERIIPKGDLQNRNFLTKALVDNSRQAIKSGMFARVSVEVENFPDALVLPRKALMKEGENYYVYKIEDSLAKKVMVEVKYQEADTAAVASEELQDGDQVVVEGSHLLKTDTPVKIL